MEKEYIRLVVSYPDDIICDIYEMEFKRVSSGKLSTSLLYLFELAKENADKGDYKFSLHFKKY